MRTFLSGLPKQPAQYSATKAVKCATTYKTCTPASEQDLPLYDDHETSRSGPT